MPRFYYSALDRDGTAVSGEIEAASSTEAGVQLELRGLTVENLRPADERAAAADDVPAEHAPASDAPAEDVLAEDALTGDALAGEAHAGAERGEAGQSAASAQSGSERLWLSDADFDQAAESLAGLTRARLPLITGMRALSEEIPSRRMSSVLAQVCRRLEAGESLETALEQHRNQIPAHLQGLIQAGVRSGRLGIVLEQYMYQARRAVELKRRAKLGLFYPGFLVFVLLLGFAFAAWLIIPQFVSIFHDFGTELPAITVRLILATDLFVSYGLWIVLSAVVLCSGVWIGLGLVLGKALRTRLCYMVPIVGPLWRAMPLAQFCNLLALLVEARTKLPEALRLAGSAVGDWNIQEGCRRLADDVEAGLSVGESATVLPHFPAHLVQIFQWERRKDVFPDALRAAGEIYDNSARSQAGLISVACEPVFVVFIAVTVGGTVMALFMPLIKLLNDLS